MKILSNMNNRKKKKNKRTKNVQTLTDSEIDEITQRITGITEGKEKECGS